MPTVNIKTVKKCALGSYDKKRINDYKNLLSKKRQEIFFIQNDMQCHHRVIE